jgi:molybdopterin-containing oxidoreductase family membrane subunit
MYARPYAERFWIGIWPTTFFLFILSAIASGPCLTVMIATLFEKIGKKRLVRNDAKMLLAKVAGGMTAFYMILKIADTLYWAYVTTPENGFHLADFFRDGPYGWWTLYLELGVFGIVPAIMLNIKAVREREGLLMLACLLNCTGIVINRFVFTIVTSAIPVQPFDKFIAYMPTWQEWFIAAGLIGYGGLVLSLTYRYLPVFPHEKELNAGAASCKACGHH